VFCQLPFICERSRTYIVVPFVGSPVTFIDTVLAAVLAAEYVPRSADPVPVVPSHNWYDVTPIPASQVKVAADPGSVLPGVGLTIDAGAVAVGGADDPVATPVPVKATVPLPPVDALLVYWSEPVAVPAPAGANARLTVTVFCGDNVIGNAPSPVIEKDWPLTLRAEICTDAVPLFVRVTDPLPVFPTVTFPNATEVAETTSVPVPAAATFGVETIEPQPDSTIGSRVPATARIAPHARGCRERERRVSSERLLWKEKEQKEEEGPSVRRGGANRTACIYLTSNKKRSKTSSKENTQTRARAAVHCRD